MMSEKETSNMRPNGSDRDQVKKLSKREYSQARSTGERRSSRTYQSSQSSEDGQKFDAFLSHSGKQKNFVRQLHRDLTKRGVFCFFDEDHESLPVGEPFPPRILAAAKSCKLAVFLLSKEFLETKWPMLELSTVVKARDKYPTIKILPLFFKIPPEALKQIKADNEKWTEFEESKEERAEFHRALRVIRGINGLKFTEGDNEVKFRDEIVKRIWHMLSTDFPRYNVPCMQGEVRMCQELANFFDKVELNKNGTRIAGLYGIAGYGKTTLCKAFCNFKLEEFDGKVCHLELSRGDSLKKKEDALQYLTHCPRPHLDTLTSQDQAQMELYRRVKGQRVLLVLDNITEESIDEVRDYLRAEFGVNSHILLSARSADVLVKHFNIESQSCMRVPRLEEKEAMAILLERTSPGESTLGAEGRGFALKCAKRCLFKEISCDNAPRARTFHPLALKAFGGYLFGKYCSNLSKWGAEIDDMVDRAGDGLDEVFSVLRKVFEDMPAKYRTIFMLLTVYMLPTMSFHKVSSWLAINCNEDISFIEKAVQDLRKKAFIEEYEPEIRIHDLYIEFAQSKANEMGRWLWWKKEDDQCSTRGWIAEDNTGFELAKLEQCMYRRIAPRYLGNLFVLQLVDVQNVCKLDLGPMERLRSVTLRDCKLLAALDGMEKLLDLAWLEIRGVNPMFKLPDVSSLEGLQHLEIDIAGSQALDQLGDLTHCFRLREINIVCPSLSEFPRLKGLKHLEKVEFSLCDIVKGPLDCTDCVKLQTILLNLCCQMAASPLLTGCRKLSKLVLSECDAVTACPEVEVPGALKILDLFISSKADSAPKNLESCCELENLQLWNMGELMELPSFKRLSNLTVLKLGKCGIREPPDLTDCDRLEDVYFFTLKNLEKFPNFSSLRMLKKLSLCNCITVQDPPYIERCHQLQLFHLLYNDNMKGLPKMDTCAQLEEIKVSWHCKDEVTYEGIDPDNCRVDEDLEYCLEYWKDEKFGNISAASLPEELKEWQWLKGKTKLAKRYFRGVKLYYSLTAPYESYKSSKCYGQSSITPVLADWGSSELYSQSCIILRLVNCKVIAFPDLTMGRDWKDYGWLNRVLKYFDGREDIARASAASVSSNIVEDISFLLPVSPRYRVPHIQGEARMCKELADFFNTVRPNEKGIRIAGLYGLSGQGKTTLAKAFCNFSLRNFYGKVFHLEFCGDKTSQRQNIFLRYLTQSPMSHLKLLTNEDDAHCFFNKLVKGQRVLFVLDNITHQNVGEVLYYLQADLGENSWILLSARSVYVLEKYFSINAQSCMRVPRLEAEEAIAILFEKKPSVASGFLVESKDFALKCAKICSFKEGGGFAPFHPLALKVFGRHLFRNQAKHLSKVAAEIDGFADGVGDCSNDVFDVLRKAFDGLEYKCRIIFMLLARRVPPNMSTVEAFMWLGTIRNEGIGHIKKAVVDLCENAFIEEIEPAIRIHELLKEFAQMNNKNKYYKFDEFKPSDEIVISRSLPPTSQRYHVLAMQGGVRMCQELADFFNTVRPNEKGIRIAGLYGRPGQGKTTLCKTFCNLNLSNFYGKVCYLEFHRGNNLGRQKLALQYITHCSKVQLQSLTREAEARKRFYERVRGQRVLLVLDNITRESIEEVQSYLEADLGENSCVLLSGQSEDVLANHFSINSESRMSVPGLEEEEAIAILLERTSLAGSAAGAENRGFALHCANKCSFKETTREVVGAAHKFHPLALKTFGRHLFSKYGANLSQWVAEADGLVFGPCDGLDDVFIVLDKAFDYIDPKHRTIFMLLTLYLVSIMSPLEVIEWLAITCKEEIENIEKAVEDLWQKGFLEEIEPEIRIHNLYMEFAQRKARKMKRWLWCKRDLTTSEAGAGLFSEDEAGFELANREYYGHLDMSAIGDEYVKNLWALQVVDRNKERSVALHNCEYLEINGGIENLPYVALLQVPNLKVLNLSSLNALQYLYIEIGYGGGITGLGDLTSCVSLREIYVRCRSLSEFPRINGLPYLEKASFKRCDEVTGPLNCSNCLKLRSIVIKYCSQMAHIPLIVNCSSLDKIVLKRCGAITKYSDETESSALDILQLCISSEDTSGPRYSECCDGFKDQPLWNIVTWRDIPSLRRLSNLTALKLYKCDISEPPDVTCCSMLEDIYFFRLKFLENFPIFSSLRKLKKLCLCNCQRVRAPPEIGGRLGLEVFHLLYNDSMEELPQMDACPQLEEFKLSWHSEEAVDPVQDSLESYKDDSHTYEDEDLYSSWNEDRGSFSDEDDDLEFSPDYQKEEVFQNLNDVFMPVRLKEWQWIQDKTVRVKRYSRGGKEYYAITAPYASHYGSRAWEQASNADSLEQVTIPTESATCG